MPRKRKELAERRKRFRALEREMRIVCSNYVRYADRIVLGQEVVQRKPYTMFKLIFEAGGREWIGVGFSKRNPIDPWNEERGIDLARDRAFVHGADQLVEENISSLRAKGVLTRYLNGEITLKSIDVVPIMFTRTADVYAKQMELVVK